MRIQANGTASLVGTFDKATIEFLLTASARVIIGRLRAGNFVLSGDHDRSGLIFYGVRDT